MTWVDGNDPEWRKEKQRYANLSSNRETERYNTEARYRDWETLAYWFRAVEQYAPWVNHIFFVTCGQKPEWLNLHHDKLRFVTHSDFMPKEYLPTFNCNPIELNLWRIPGLSEHFVYFNDDQYLNWTVKPEDFFENGLPKECAIAKPLYANSKYGNAWEHLLLNDISIINSTFNIRESIEHNTIKWFSHVMGVDAVYNRRLYDDGYLSGMNHTHLPKSYLKTSFIDLWDKQEEALDKTSRCKFRDSSNNTNYLVTLWMLFSGDYCPVKKNYFGFVENVTSESIERVLKALNSPQYMMICLNDGDNTGVEEFELLKQKIIEAFAKKFPEKSSFEL